MEQLLELRRREELSDEELSRRTGIARGTLAWWGSRLGSGRPRGLRRRARAGGVTVKARPRRPGFTEISWNGRVVDRESPSDSLSCPYEVVLAAGQRILLPEHFDARRVAELVRMLEDLPC